MLPSSSYVQIITAQFSTGTQISTDSTAESVLVFEISDLPKLYDIL